MLGKRGQYCRNISKTALLFLIAIVVLISPVYAYAQDAGQRLKSNVSLANMPLNATNSRGSYEELDCIRASYYMNRDTPVGKSVEYLLNGDLVFDEIMFGDDKVTKGLANNKQFITAVGGWKAAHYFTGSSSPAEDALDMQGYFEAIIFAVLKADVSSRYSEGTQRAGSTTESVNDLVGKQNKVSQGIVDAMGDMEILKYDYGKLSLTDRNKLRGILENIYIDEHPHLSKWTQGSDSLDTFLSAAKDVQEGVESIVSYGNLVDGLSGQKELLARMFQQCSENSVEEIAFKAALGAASKAMQGTIQSYLTGSAVALEKVAGKTAYELMRMGLDEAVRGCPHLQAFMIGAKLGDAISTAAVNQLFTTDALIEQYEKSLALAKFNDLAVEVTKTAGNNYQRAGALEDAQVLIAGVDALYNAKLESLDYTREFYDLVYQRSTYGRLFTNKSEYQKAVNTIQNIGKDIESVRDGLYDTFKVSFYSEEPSLYEQYFGAWIDPLTNSPLLEGIHFPASEYTIYMNDPVHAIPAAVGKPDGAITGSISYASSDDTILHVNEHNVGCVPYREGVVTVKAVCDDDTSKTAAITVKVVNGSSDSGARNNAESSNSISDDAEVAMSLVFDVSGSMDDSSGVSGMTKLQSAQQQTRDFVSTTKRQSDNGELAARMSVSAFASGADTFCDLTDDFDAVLAGIDGLSAYGATNMYAGMSEGIEQLQSATGQKLMVFLSDGLNNEGASNADILALANEAAAQDIRIYTIGFGPQGDLDEDLLRQIADITGGTYAHEDASSLSAATVGLFATLMETRLAATSDVKLSTVGSVRQGEVAEAGSFDVEEEGDLDMYLYWPGSALDFVITDPTGAVVESGYIGYSIDASTIPTTVSIANAMTGTWKVDVYGREVSMVQEPFYAAVSYRKAQRIVASGGGGGAPNGGEGLLFLLVAVAALSIGGVYALSIRKNNG